MIRGNTGSTRMHKNVHIFTDALYNWLSDSYRRETEIFFSDQFYNEIFNSDLKHFSHGTWKLGKYKEKVPGSVINTVWKLTFSSFRNDLFGLLRKSILKFEIIFNFISTVTKLSLLKTTSKTEKT